MTERLRVLFATPQLPGRTARHGGGTYLAELLLAMAEEADVSLVSLARPFELGLERTLTPPLARAKAVRHLWNADMSSLQLFMNRARLLAHTALGGLPLVVAKFRSSDFVRALRGEIASFRPHAVCLDHSVTAQYLPHVADLPTILTDHEAGGSGPRWLRYVRRFYPLATLIQAVTHEDAGALWEELHGAPIEVRPVVVPVPERSVDPASTGTSIGFLANWSHAPNREAASFVARSVVPRVRAEVASAELLLAGDQQTADIAALAELPGVRVLGAVPSPADFLAQVRCLVAPVFSGGGTRVKVLTALAHGVPVVTNALGARGLGSAPSAALPLGETADEISAAAVAFLREPDAAAKAGALGREWCRSRPDAKEIARAQLERIRTIAGR